MSKHKKKKAEIKKEEKHVNFLANLPERSKNTIAVIIILIPLLYYFLPWMLNGQRPVGSDYLASIGQTHRWVEWAKETGETVLWNPSIFGGEPIYSRLTPSIIHIDTFIGYLARISYWVFWYLLLGGIGIYLFLRYLKIPWYLAVIVAVVFVMLPDWQALIGEGHNSKFRAVMTLPWVFWSFAYFFDKNSWLGAGLFAFAFSWLVRTHHFQIVFYGILVLFFLYIYPVVKMLIDKKYKQTVNLLLKFVAALVLVFMTAAQPLFTTNEYAKYSTRGGNPVKIGAEAKTAEKAGGVSFEYATQWSFAPDEIMSFFIPRYNGGLQGEIYNGKEYPQLKGRQVPGYWGAKPFNGNYASMGMILFLFAIIGTIYYRKDKFVIALAVFIVFSILLSFGRHFPEFYKLFFYYVPYFSKFRAPSMILNVTFIMTLILSGYGLKAVVEGVKDKDFKWIMSVFGIAIVIVGGILLLSNTFNYMTSIEPQRYDANTMKVIKTIRREFLVSDTRTLLIFLIVIAGIVAAYLKKKIKIEVFSILVLLAAGLEIFTVSNRAHKYIHLGNPKKLEQSEFKATPISKVLSSADDSQRAIVLGRDFTSNHYAYFYPLINGYSAIKLQVIQDVIAHNLNNAPTQDKINWNIINMLNGKYIISPAQLNEGFLTGIAADQGRKQIMYKNSNSLPKAWFVKTVKKFSTPESLVLFMNDTTFNPASEALVVGNNKDETFTGSGNIKLLKKDPNSLTFDIKTDSPQFLVLSETYYPKGWIAKVNDKELRVLQVNHILRGVEVPKGEYKLTFNFHPETYFASVTAVWVGDILIWLIILLGIYSVYKRKKKLT